MKLSEIDPNAVLEDGEYKHMLPIYQIAMSELGRFFFRKERPVIIVFEGWDAAGKGSVIKRLTRRLDPRFYEVHAIAKPEGDDARKHYLYRFWRRLPEAGQIGIFDRSWYGRVMVERIEGFCKKKEWKRAYEEINAFERQLNDFGTVIFKFFIHISEEEQLNRFNMRQEAQLKKWKLTDEDWRNRAKWNEYENAINDMIDKTHTNIAPWSVIPGNNKQFARIEVLKIVVEKLSEEFNFDPLVKYGGNTF
jgi:polyphosphate kinase 2 (PPK2 family)